MLTATASVQKTIQQSESKRSFNFNTEETERRSSSQVVNLLGTTFPKPQKQRQHFRAAGSNFTGMTCLVEMTPRLQTSFPAFLGLENPVVESLSQP